MENAREFFSKFSSQNTNNRSIFTHTNILVSYQIDLILQFLSHSPPKNIFLSHREKFLCTNRVRKYQSLRRFCFLHSFTCWIALHIHEMWLESPMLWRSRKKSTCLSGRLNVVCGKEKGYWSAGNKYKRRCVSAIVYMNNTLSRVERRCDMNLDNMQHKHGTSNVFMNNEHTNLYIYLYHTKQQMRVKSYKCLSLESVYPRTIHRKSFARIFFVQYKFSDGTRMVSVRKFHSR